MSPAPRPSGVGGGRIVRPALPTPPHLAEAPLPPVELSRITEQDRALAALVGMEPHEVNLMWQFAQHKCDNEVVLAHIKRLFASIKLTDEDFLQYAADTARVIENYHAQVRAVNVTNANRMKQFVDKYDTFEKDSNEEFHAVNRVYLAFMRSLRKGMEWERVTPAQRELLKQMQAQEIKLDVARFRSLWIGAKMVRLDSDIPKLSQSVPFYGWARLLLED